MRICPMPAISTMRTIETRDGYLMQTIRLGGLLFETADSDELNYRAELRDAMLRSLGIRASRSITTSCADAPMHLSANYPDEFSRRLDARWQKRLASRQLYVNELFLTGCGVRSRAVSASPTDEPQVRRGAGGDDEATRRKTGASSTTPEAMVSALRQYDPQVLSTYETDEGAFSEPLEFLSCLYNADLHPVAMPHGDLGHFVPARRVSFGQDTVELAPAGNLPRRFVAMVSIKDWPSQPCRDVRRTARLPFEMPMSQSFAFVERRAALGRMNLALRRMRSAEDEALSPARGFGRCQR